MTVPNGPDDTATFDVSNTTDVTISDGFDAVNGIVFTASAPAFTIHISGCCSSPCLYPSGAGVTNNSTNVQTLFVKPPRQQGGGIVFSANATAANLQILDLGSWESEGGTAIWFFDSSTASNATISGPWKLEGRELSY